MSVNYMNFEQAGKLLSAINAQTTGKTTLTPINNLSDFVSVAQDTKRVGVEPFMRALAQVLERTLFNVRPYTRRFRGLEVSNGQFGAITRKVNFADKALKEYNDAWPYLTGEGDETQLDDGLSVDPWIIWKPDVLETRFYGSAVYAGQYTIFEDQLEPVFRDPEEFGAFITSLLTHFSNEREMWLENVERSALLNAIGGKLLQDDYINLGDLYGTTATIEKYNHLIRDAYATIGEISDLMQSRTQLYQQSAGKDINRNTPKQDQRAYFNSRFIRDIEARTLSTTYNDNWLEMIPHDRVDYWQNVNEGYRMSVNVNAAYWDFDKKEIVSGEVNKPHVVGILFDRDALGVNIYKNTLKATRENPRADYYNLFAKTRVRLYNDFTEKMVVFAADDSGASE